MGFILGFEANLMINLYAPQIGTARAAWPASGLPQTSQPADIAEFGNVRNVRQNFEIGKADVTTRDGNGWRQFAPTIANGGLEFETIWDPDDPLTTALLVDVAIARVSVWAIALDKTTTGGQGLWADYVVTDFSRNEDLEEALVLNITMEPARGTVSPGWETVGA